VKNLYYSKVFV